MLGLVKVFFAACVAVFCVALSVLHAKAGPYHNYAAIAVNLKDGEMLYAQNVDKKVHLASITKLMTLYLTFEALREGRISLNDKVVISEFASRQIEKKMRLVKGARYSLKELILFSAIFSANDATVAIAEEIAGSAEDFVYLMNQKAVLMGLKDTKYTNVTGTPESINYSTPREVIRLSQRLRHDFPEYYVLFGKELFVYNGEIYGNSNRLLPYFKGMDGLKTGFINLSGYNLVCSFKYNEEVIVGAVFGLPTAQQREKHMREIMDYSVKKVLYRKMRKDKNGEMVSEYDDFLKYREDLEPSGSLYFQIFSNIIEQGKVTKSIADLDKRTFSVVDKALSEISSFGDLLSHPMPIFEDDA